MYNYDQLLSFYSDVSVDGDVRGSTRLVSWSVIYIKILQITNINIKHSFKNRHLQQDGTKESAFYVSDCSPRPCSTRGKKPGAQDCLLGWIKLSQLVSRYPDAGGAVPLTLPYMAPGWLHIYLWGRVYLWVGAYYLGIYTLYAARGATKHLLCSPRISLVSVLETHFHFSHRCPRTDRDSALQVKIHVDLLHFNEKAGESNVQWWETSAGAKTVEKSI